VEETQILEPGPPLLSLDNVSRTFGFGSTARVAVTGVSFELLRNRTIAVVGESGAGKSTLARLIAGLDRPSTGTVLIDGRPPRLRAGVPSPVQMVFQDPREALNPFLPIGTSLAAPLRRQPADERRSRVAQLLTQVGLDPKRAGERPAAFSGGQQQRIVIARALAANPRLLVCDEPTSSLDVSVQAQIVNLILQLQQDLKFACVLVTHDLAVARVLADDILVLEGGVVIEHTPADQFFREPAAAYSRGLLAANAGQALPAQPRYESESDDRRLQARG
jgi:ABC-type dipeptide/oligopeptide/nickel transport system ATPase subunit